jgi:perosamine synthetase
MYDVVDNGNKYNPTDITSSLGLVQLKKLEWMRDKREDIAKKYDKAFIENGIEVLKLKKDRKSSYHLYVIKVNNRDKLYQDLKDSGINSSVHFIPIHKMSYYKTKYGYKESDYPVANRVFEKSLSLPIYPDLKDDEVEYIIEKVLEYAE